MSGEIRFYRAVGEHGYLSNLFRRPVEFEGRTFRCSEEAYQAGKAKDPAVAGWIVSAPKPHLCAAAAHALFAFDVRPDWNAIKVDRMRAVLRAKFGQHPDLAGKLLGTGDAVLIEESHTDAFWGCGKSGKGKNMLGVLLMEIRDELRAGGVPPKGSDPMNEPEPIAITKYRATDGVLCDTRERAARRNATLAEIARVMAPLGPRPEIPGDSCAFTNGHGYKPHDPAVVARVRADLVEAVRPEIARYAEENGEPEFGFLGRLLDDNGSLWCPPYIRLLCIDETGREWGQPFYTRNPDRASDGRTIGEIVAEKAKGE